MPDPIENNQQTPIPIEEDQNQEWSVFLQNLGRDVNDLEDATSELEVLPLSQVDENRVSAELAGTVSFLRQVRDEEQKPTSVTDLQRLNILKLFRDRIQDARQRLVDLKRAKDTAAAPAPTEELYTIESQQLNSQAQRLIDDLNRDPNLSPTIQLTSIRQSLEDFQLLMNILENGSLSQRQTALNYRRSVINLANQAIQSAERRATELGEAAFSGNLTNAETGIPALANMTNEVNARLNRASNLASLSAAEFRQLRQDLEANAATIGTLLADPGHPIEAFGSDVVAHFQVLLNSIKDALSRIQADVIRRNHEAQRAPDFQVRDSLYRFMAEPPLPIPFLDDDLADQYGGITIAKYMSGKSFAFTPDQAKSNPEHYFSLVTRVVLEKMSYVVWNKTKDQASTHAYTADYRTDPFRGPVAKMDLNGQTITYNSENQNRVKNLESFFDLFATIFDDPNFKQASIEVKGRLKTLSREISIWHNRAFVIRENTDRVGPDGSLKALQAIDNDKSLSPTLEALFHSKEKRTQEEINFGKAIEFCMGVWSFWSLSKPNQDKVRSLRSPEVADITDEPDYQNIASTGFTNPERRVPFINAMIDKAQGFGLSINEAQLAYHIGETFRIGSSIETALDVFYDSKGNVKVPSQNNGAAKGMFPGLYAEYADANPERPDYIKTYGRFMAKAYPTFAEAWQATHSYKKNGAPRDISGWGDNRANLAELLSVEGGIDSVDWNQGSLSSTPDTIVSAMASQAVPVIWPRISLESGKDPKYLFFVKPEQLRTKKTGIIANYKDILMARRVFGYPRREDKRIARFGQAVRITPETDFLEMNSFNTTADEFQQGEKDAVNKTTKDFRDYWLGPVNLDNATHPMDAVRLLNALFTRDGRPPGNEGYVHPKIKLYIEKVRDAVRAAELLRGPIDWNDSENEALQDLKGWIKKDQMALVNAYITYDVLMRANLELYAPDFNLLSPELRKLAEHSGHPVSATDPHVIEEIYNEMEFSSYSGHSLLTKGGFPTMHKSRVHALIDRTVALRDVFDTGVGSESDPVTVAKNAGYTLDEFPTDLEISRTHEKLFTRHDILALLQRDYHLGEGYHYDKGPNMMGNLEFKLIRDNFEYANPNLLNKERHLVKKSNASHVTVQYLLDRVALLNELFGQHAHGSGSH